MGVERKGGGWDLYKVRNVKPGLKWGLWAGTVHGGAHMWLNDLGLGALVTLDAAPPGSGQRVARAPRGPTCRKSTTRNTTAC